MATTRMSLTEKARVWNSLDDNLRDQVREGLLSLEEAAGFVVPIGDLELRDARAKQEQQAQAAAAPPAKEPNTLRDLGTFARSVVQIPATVNPNDFTIQSMAKTNLGRLGQSVDALQAEASAAELGIIDDTAAARERPWYESVVSQLSKDGVIQRIGNLGATDLITPAGPLGAAADILARTAQSTAPAVANELRASFTDPTNDERRRVETTANLNQHIRDLEAGTNYLKTLPQNPFSTNAVNAFNSGDYGLWAANIIPAALSVMGEQGIELATSAAVVGGTYAVTRNPAVTAAVAKASSGITSSTEYGADLAELWEQVPEGERTLEKFKEVQAIARQSALGRATIEAALPGVGAQLGTTAFKRAGLELGLQMGSGALGEEIAQRVKTGQGGSFVGRALSGTGASAGELVLEAAADSAGVVTEAGPTLARAAARDADDARTEANYQAAINRDFEASRQELNQQRLADANRDKFDVEQQAEEAIRVAREAEALNNATQMEMPFGSGYGGNISPTNADGTPTLDADGQPLTATGRRVPENDRVPTITDMFSGESTAAPKVVERQQQAEQAAAEGRMPEETDEQFEIRKQRETDARNQIDARKQSDFENHKNRQRIYRQQLAEAKVTVRNQRQRLSTADITREAKRLLEIEKEGVRKQRAGIARTPERMAAVLKAYERQRLPDLIDNVRTRRIAEVTAAEDLLMSEKERQKNLDDIRTQNELASRQDERAAANRPAPELATDLFDDQPGQRDLALGEPSPTPKGAYTGSLTDEQAATELAAGQLARQRRVEKDKPAKEAERSANLKAETTAASRAVAETQQKRDSLTQKTYDNKESKHRASLVKKELDNRNGRTDDQITEAVAAGMVEWRQANPAPQKPQEAATTADLEQRARTIQNRREGAEKRKDTTRTNKELEKELAAGATPEEAAERVANRQMSPEEDAEVRALLGSKRTRRGEDRSGNKTPMSKSVPVDSAVVTAPDGQYIENNKVREALDKELASKRPSLGNILDAIRKDTNATAGERWLAGVLAPIVRNLGIKLETADLSADRPSTAGAYLRNPSRVWIRAANRETVLHEVLHAVTSDFTLSSVAKQNPVIRAAVAQLEFALAQAKNAVAMGDVVLPGNIPQKRWNAATESAREFLAHAMTESEFQEFLATIPMPGQQRSVWQAMKAAIKSLFRPKTALQNSVLDSVIEATGDLVDTASIDPALHARAAAEVGGRFARTVDQSALDPAAGTLSRRNFLLGAAGLAASGVAVHSGVTGDVSTLGKAEAIAQEILDTPLNAATTAILHGELPGAERLRAALDEASRTGPAELRALAAQTRDQLPKSGVQIVINESAGGSVAGAVSLRSNIDGGPGVRYTMFPNNEGWDYGTMIHEAMHINVVARYGSLSTGIMRSNDAILGPISVPAEKAMAEFTAIWQEFKTMFYGLSANDRSNMDERTKVSITEALRSPDEFFVRAETDGRLQKWMAGKKYGGKTLLQKFRDWVKYSLLGFNKSGNVPSWLDAALEASKGLTVAMESDAADFKRLGKEFIEGGRGLNETLNRRVVADPTGDPVSERSFVGPRKALRPEWSSATGEAIADSFTAGGGKTDFKKGIKSRISEIFERSSAETGAYILRAEQLFKQMDSGLSKQAAKAGKDQDAFRKEFAADVEKFEQADGRVTKAAEARALNKKYNKVARSYFRARRTIDQLSNEILQQRLADPTPFTEGEAKIYLSIKENVGRYYTRIYAANTKGIGTARAKKLWREYDGLARGEGNEDFRDGYETVRNAIDYVANNNLVVPEESVMEEMSMADLQDLAKAWGVSIGTGASLDSPMTTEVRKEALIQELGRFRDATPGVRQQRARVLVEDLLFARNHAALSKYYRGEQTDRTIVQDRKFVPDEIRELLGEYKDLPLKAMTTIIRMSAFKSKTKAFQEFLEAGRGTTVLTDEELTERGLSPQDWKKLTEASYGPLQNMWVRKDVADKLAGTVEITRTFDQMLAAGEAGAKARVTAAVNTAADGWMWAASMIKQAQLVWNSSNAVLNYSGGGVAMVSNGNTSIESVRRAHKIASGLVAAQASGHLTKDMEKVVRAGITDSAMLGAIRKVEAEKLDEILFANLRSPFERKKERIYQQGAAAGRTWKEAYAMADVVWKIANFLEDEANLTAYYKAEGIDISPEAIEREAAWRTNLSNFSYKRVPNFLKDIEKAGLTYVMPYIYETFRAPVGSFMVAINNFQKASQATTPEGKRIMMLAGSKRALGSVLSLGAMQMATFVAIKMLDNVLGEGDEEEEKWIERLKVFLPEYKKYSDFFYMGRNERGEPVLFEFSRTDPFGPSSEFFRMAAAGAKPDEYLEAMQNLVIGNPYGKGILQAFFGQSGTNTRIEGISQGQYDKLVQLIGTRGTKAVDTIMPSAILRPFDPNNAPAEGDMVGAIFTAMGGQVYNIQPTKAVRFMVMRYDQERNDIREDFSTILKTRTELTDNALLSELVSLRAREAKAFDALTESYQGMLELGYTPEQVLGQMKASGLKESDIPTVALGYRPEMSGIVNLAGIAQSYKQMPDDDPARKEKYLNNIRRLMALVESGQVPARRR